MSFYLEVISPDGKVFEGEVKKISVPAVTGELTILSKHIPLFTPLDMGEVKIVDIKDRPCYFAIGKGMMEVKRGRVILAIEDVGHVDEISEKKALAAKEEAEKILARKPKGEELLTAKQALRRSFIDLKVARKRKTRPRLSSTSEL